MKAPVLFITTLLVGMLTPAAATNCLVRSCIGVRIPPIKRMTINT